METINSRLTFANDYDFQAEAVLNPEYQMLWIRINSNSTSPHYILIHNESLAVLKLAINALQNWEKSEEEFFYMEQDVLRRGSGCPRTMTKRYYSLLALLEDRVRSQKCS